MLTHAHYIIHSGWLEVGECVVPGAGEAGDEGDRDSHLTPVARPWRYSPRTGIFHLKQNKSIDCGFIWIYASWNYVRLLWIKYELHIATEALLSAAFIIF